MFAGDGREERFGAPDRSSEEGTAQEIVSGVDCLICAMF